VKAVLREFHTKAVEWAFVHARNEPFDRLVGEEFKTPEALLQFRCWVDGHGMQRSKVKQNVPTKVGRDVSMLV
jgi:hypothetical protein